MLKRIYIKNFAIIEESEVFLNRGLNIFTGETGSGKSLIFQAINIALGNRASFDLIRNGENKCIIEVEFDGFEKENLLNELKEKIDFEASDSLIFRREININGTSRSFLNDSPIQMKELKLIAMRLYDHHGQLQTSNLLNKEFQLEMLDNLAGNEELLNNYKEKYYEFSNLIEKKNKIIRNGEKLKKDRDYWEFQLNEINKINPNENEDEVVENELNVVENIETLFELSNNIINDLYEGELNSYLLLNNAIKSLINMNNIDNKFSDFVNDLESAKISIEEAFKAVNSYKNNIDFDNERVEYLKNRHLDLKKLIKKYGSIDDCLNEKKDLEEKLSLIDNFDDEIQKLKVEIEDKRIELSKVALNLSKLRIDNAKIISNELNNELKEIGLENSNFSIKVDFLPYINNGEFYVLDKNEKLLINENGINDVEFYISTNTGELAKPISEIASGGEMSRVMLAMKALSKDKKGIGTLLLDEIDTGISGRIAQKVGKYMNKIANTTQILTITHLPQIAANANNHYLIEKYEEENRTFSKINLLDSERSLIEIAKLFSGEKLTETSIINAKQLVDQI